MMFSGIPVQLIIAFVVDLLIGDPSRIPHPVRCIGLLISRTESFLRRYTTTAITEKAAGALLVLLVVGSTYIITYLFVRLLTPLEGILVLGIFSVSDLIVGVAGSLTIALRGLKEYSGEVLSAIERSDHGTARMKLSMIVGRETEFLDEEGIVRATIETVAENTSDGVIAPLFYFMIGGLPLAMTYKAVNTLDSMIGYRNKRYINFGYAAARIDDLANYLPARLTGLFILLSVAVLKTFRRDLTLSLKGALRVMVKDGGRHPSPNAGIPEAAIAGALGIRLGGPSVYDGVEYEKPYLGEGGRAVKPEDGYVTIKVAGITGFAGMIIFVALRVLC
jgi:adenosylcobinamide-phosphate synthase